jgi:hypothetical protein
MLHSAMLLYIPEDRTFHTHRLEKPKSIYEFMYLVTQEVNLLHAKSLIWIDLCAFEQRHDKQG